MPAARRETRVPNKHFASGTLSGLLESIAKQVRAGQGRGQASSTGQGGQAGQGSKIREVPFSDQAKRPGSSLGPHWGTPPKPPQKKQTQQAEPHERFGILIITD